MAEDASVLVLGEDVGIDGGVFRATDGLLQLFGEQRVLDTPLAEASIAGVSIGLAAQGFRPVAEIQFTGFAYTCIDQLINHASRLRTRTRGRLTCPMVLRSPAGGGINAVEHHSESPEAMFAHIPGLEGRHPVVAGARLRPAAVGDPRSRSGRVPGADPALSRRPRGGCRRRRRRCRSSAASCCAPGSDVTLVSWGAMLKETLEAAERLAAENVEAEVIDVATLKPLDAPPSWQSVARTGRLVIVHEAPIDLRLRRRDRRPRRRARR